jgi:serine/threonine protein kinase
MDSKLSQPESRSAPPQRDPDTHRPEPMTPSEAAPSCVATRALDVSTPDPNRSSPAPPLPRIFGPYLIEEELGRGGMGIVYKAHDGKLNRHVALKMIRGGFASAEDTERFFREAKAVAQLKHRHIVKIHDFGEIDGQQYFTMELAERGNLAKNLKHFAGNVRGAVALMEKIARAVQYMHDSNLLHRDLKPGNILLEPGDEPVVSDFGLAKQLAPTDAALTATGDIPGTPAYMAPEQVTGSAAVSQATDIWALGVILFELVCGQRPFTGPTRDKIAEAIVQSDPPDPRSLQPTVDRSLEAVILKCMKKDSRQRYATAGEFADDLGRWLRHEPTLAQPQSWPRRLARRYGKVLLVSAALALAAAMLSFAAFYVSSRAMPPDKSDPDIVLNRDLLPRIERNQRTVLVGGRGKPAWSRPIFAGVEVKSNDGTFTVEAGSAAMIELLPSVPVTRYEFRAEVRQKPGGTGKTGVYFCRTGHTVTWGEFSGFCALTFHDWGAQRGLAYLEMCHNAGPHSGWPNGYFPRIQQDPHKTFVSAEEQLRPGPKPTPQAELEARAATWRSLSVKITPDAIHSYWDGELITTLSKADRAKGAHILTLKRPNLEGQRPEFPADAGLGLYVFQTSASFRNVIIQPLLE